MRSPYKFIVTPFEGKYRTTKDVAGKKLYLTASIEDAKYVKRIGIVESVPLTYRGNIKKGDKIVLHHNIFRDYYNHKGKVTNSNHTLIYEGEIIFLVEEDLIYLYSSGSEWKAHNDYCFIRPIKTTDKFSKTQVLDERKGVVVYSNELEKGSLIGFTSESEYEFVLDDETLYRMRNSNICLIDEGIKY